MTAEAVRPIRRWASMLCLVAPLVAAAPVTAAPMVSPQAAPPPAAPAPAPSSPAPSPHAAPAPAVPAPAALSAAAAAPIPVTLRVTSLVPPFLAFHADAVEMESTARRRAAANQLPVDEEAIASERRRIRDRHLADGDGLLGRIPGEEWEPEGLEEAWTRYADVLEHIEGIESTVSVQAGHVLREVAELLQLDRPLEVHLILYVGTFRDLPAFRLRGDEYAILLPAEVLSGSHRPMLVDLMSRAVHARLAGRPPSGTELSLAEHLAVRGLALRVHEELEPGLDAHRYLARSDAWLREAERRDGPIMDWARERLSVPDPEVLATFVEGGGATGLGGELDYAAWRVSGLLLMGGWTLHRWAREPFRELEGRVWELLEVP